MDKNSSLQLAKQIRLALTKYDYPNHFVIDKVIQSYFADKYSYIKDVSSVTILDNTVSLEDANQILIMAENRETLDEASLLYLIDLHKKRNNT